MTDAAERIPLKVLERLMEHGVPVRAAREAAGMEIAELADHCGVAADRLFAFESGNGKPTAEEADAISLATGVPADLFNE
jgi:transcriptional regulator with XRE-family HTH domain